MPFGTPRALHRPLAAGVASAAAHVAAVVALGALRGGGPEASPPPETVQLEVVEAPAEASPERPASGAADGEAQPTAPTTPARRTGPRGPAGPGRLALQGPGVSTGPFRFGQRLDLGDLTPRIARVDPGRFVHGSASDAPTPGTEPTAGGPDAPAAELPPAPTAAVDPPAEARDPIAAGASAAEGTTPDEVSLAVVSVRREAVVGRLDRPAPAPAEPPTDAPAPLPAVPPPDLAALGLVADDVEAFAYELPRGRGRLALTTRLLPDALLARLADAATASGGELLVATDASGARTATFPSPDSAADTPRGLTVTLLGAQLVVGPAGAGRSFLLAALREADASLVALRVADLDRPGGRLTLRVERTPDGGRVRLSFAADEADTTLPESVVALAAESFGVSDAALARLAERLEPGASQVEAALDDAALRTLLAALVAPR